MDSAKIFANHFIMLAELVGLWSMLDMGVHIKRKTVRTMKSIILLIGLEAILWSVEKWTQSFDTLSIARPLLTSTIYLLYPIIMLVVIHLTEIADRYVRWLSIPVIISAPVLYTSQWTHLIFWMTEDNLYHNVRNPLKYYSYYLVAIYLLIFLFLLLKYNQKISRRDRMSILWCIAIAVLGVMIMVIADMDVDYSTLFASVLVLYYLFIYTKTAKADTLTGLLNRQCYYADEQRERDRITCVVSVDMNDLKKINDSQGHEAGDLALMTVSKCLSKGMGGKKHVYRIGGDEFAIFYLYWDEDDVRTDIAAMQKLLSKTDYVCAFGYQMVEDGMELCEAMREADRKMYLNKSELKGTAAPQSAK